MKTLLLDCDGVVCDCATPVYHFAQRYLRNIPFVDAWTQEFPHSWNVHESDARWVMDSLRYSRLCREIQLYPGAAEAIHRLKDVFDLVFVTAEWDDYPDWVPARKDLLKQFGCDIVFTHAKHRVVGDILCDDRPSNLLAPRAVCFDQPWNRHLINVRRITALDQLLELA